MIQFDVADIEPDREITEGYRRIRDLTGLGSQYDWLARFANKDPGLELCLEKSYHGKAPKCILKYGTLTKVTEGDIMYYKLVEEKSEPDLYKIFGNMHFPIPLFEITKYGLIEEYNKLGFKNTIAKTWFCHHPINDEPCGTCNPCKVVIKEGLGFRMTPAGMKRYETEMKYGDHVWFRYYKKIRQKITKRL